MEKNKYYISQFKWRYKKRIERNYNREINAIFDYSILFSQSKYCKFSEQENNLLKNSLKKEIENIIEDCLTEREMFVIILRFFYEFTLQEVAESKMIYNRSYGDRSGHYVFSRERIRQIELKALRKIKGRLIKNGINKKS